MKNEVRADRIANFLAAGYSGFIIKTTENDRAIQIVTDVINKAKRRDKNVYSIGYWDLDSADNQNPLDPLEKLTKSSQDLMILILQNYHWFLDKPPIIQKIQNSMELWRNKGKAIIILTPFPEVPLEIRKDFMILELPLPAEAEIRECMWHIAKSVGDDSLLDGENEVIIQAAKGLTKTEIENVLSLSFAEKEAFDVKIINEQKIQTIEKSGLIRVLRTDKTYKDILGYDMMKTVVSKMIKKRTSKGVLVVGPPGCGKTLFMECTVGEFNKIGILINFGLLYSKYQGEGSQNVEEIIKIIEAIGDCVVITDEFEKQFSGAASTGETDSGVARRMTGRWLQFMQEKPEGVYMMGTCNSFKGIPDEYLRVGRWDSSPFYIDLPNDQEKKLILDYYIKKLKLADLLGKDSIGAPNMPQWTGAEIESCCHMARNLECSLAEASKFINPQNKAGFAEANALKEFAIPATSINEVISKRRRIDKA